MKRRPPIERIATRAEAAFEPKMLERYRQRQRFHQPAYPLDRIRVDPTELIPFRRWHERAPFGAVQTELREQALDIEPRRCEYAREVADSNPTEFGNAAGATFWFRRSFSYHRFGTEYIGFGLIDFGRDRGHQP